MHANQIRVRLAEEADAAPIAEIYRPFVESTPVTFEIVPPSAAEFAERIFAKVMPRYPWLVCERDGAVLGYAYANQFRARQAYDWSTEVSVYVGEGRGVKVWPARSISRCTSCSSRRAFTGRSPA